MSVATIKVDEVHEKHLKSERFFLIDVREISEYETVRVAYAKNVPLSCLKIDALLKELNVDKDKSEVPIYFICRSGSRSLSVASECKIFGFDHVYNVVGGMIAWQGMNLPVEP